MKGILLSVQMILLFGIVARSQEFFPIDSYEMYPASEDYYHAREETSRHDDNDDYYPLDYDSREDDYRDLRENDALYDSPSRLSDRKQKRREYFDGLAKKVPAPSRKDRHLDLMAGASHPEFRSRTKRARLSDYDLYYPKRQVKNEDSRSSTQPPMKDFDFDDFMFTTSTPDFDSERPRYNRQKESPRHYDDSPRPVSRFKSDTYDKTTRPVEPRRPMPRFKDDSYSKQSHSVAPRRPMPLYTDDIYSKDFESVEPRIPTPVFKDDVYRKSSHSVEPRRPVPRFKDDSYNKVFDSAEQNRPTPVLDDSYDNFHYPAKPHRSNSGFKDDSYKNPSHSVKPHRPSTGFSYQEESPSKIYDEPLRPSSEFKADSYSKSPYEPSKPSSGFNFHVDSSPDERRRPLEDYRSDFDSKSFLDGPSSEYSYQTESYPNLSSKESYYKKPTGKIRQRSKRIEVDPPLKHTLRSKPSKSDPLDGFFSVPKSKDTSSRSARRPIRVKSPARKLSDVHGRSALYDDDFPKKPLVVSFKKDKRRPGIFTEEKRHYLAATGYGKPVREQFHEQGTKGPHSYKFGYNTGDKDNPMARYEERSPDGLVKGSYSYVDPLGKLKVVHYESHPDHGFKTTL